MNIFSTCQMKEKRPKLHQTPYNLRDIQGETCPIQIKSLRLAAHGHERFLSVVAGLRCSSGSLMLYNSPAESAIDE